MRKVILLIPLMLLFNAKTVDAMRKKPMKETHISSHAKGAVNRADFVEDANAVGRVGETEEAADAERPCSWLTKPICYFLIGGAALLVAGGSIFGRFLNSQEDCSAIARDFVCAPRFIITNDPFKRWDAEERQRMLCAGYVKSKTLECIRRKK